MKQKFYDDKDRQVALMQSFWHLQKSIMLQVKQTAANHNLSLPQFAILSLMERDKQIAQKKLQERTHYPKSTISHAIEGLVVAGLLHRSPMKGNRREMDLALSESGKALLVQIKSQEDSVHVRFKNAVDSFSAEEFSRLMEMHQHITAFFEGSEAE